MKIGVYFCTCGTNIGDRIDSDRVREQLEADGVMAYFTTAPFLCSEEGKQSLEQDLREKRPDRIVIAACSPREHEATFMRVMTRAGMNPFLMQMVNIREQVAWVTQDPDRAVAKTVLAIRGALKRVALHEELERQELEVSPAVLVIGAGPAGLRAALSLAEAGRQVTLVERSPAIGGLPVMYEELFPTMECGPCMLEPLMGEILHGEHAGHIELLTMAQVESVAGYFGNFCVTLRQRPRYVDSHQCIGCGECFEPCPVSGPNPYNCGMDERKAIGFTVMGALPNAPHIDPALCTRFTEGSDCTACSAACPMGEGVVRYDDQEQLLERQVGAVVIATGASLYDSSCFDNLGYGRLADVRTAFEFERLLASNGPTGGQVLTADGQPPRSVAVIHCVGSLDEGHQPYCSGICCQYAFKFNHLLEARLPDTRVHHLYREIVAPGKEEYALHQAARHNPRATFTRYAAIGDLTVESGEGGQRVALGDGTVIAADLVVLCPAVVPNPDAEQLAKLLDVPLDRFGFFEELHGRMDAARSKLRGVYLAGACQAPTDIQRATTQGMAASGHILSELVEGRTIELGPLFAAVDPERCAGCWVCQNVCPYNATSFDEEKHVAMVNAVLCRGCGTCVAACPLDVIKANHFTKAMILAEIEGVLK